MIFCFFYGVWIRRFTDSFGRYLPGAWWFIGFIFDFKFFFFWFIGLSETFWLGAPFYGPVFIL